MPQLLLVIEEQERGRIRSMLDQADAVSHGASALFDDKHLRTWRDKLTKLL